MITINITIRPTQKQLDKWIENYIPEKDLFFLRANDLPVYQNELQGALLFPRKEFFKHSSYTGIQMVNSYMYWNISKDAEFVVVSHPDWISSLPSEKQEALFTLQYKLGRGLTGPLSLLTDNNLIPQDYVIEVNGEQIGILQRAMWIGLPTSIKEEIICKTAQFYDEWTSIQAPATIPAHLKKYANTFSTKPGANCLAAALYAISSSPDMDEWIIHEWVHDETFALGLKSADFAKTKEEFTGGDVVVWVDENEIIKHAAYCIEDKLFFNKNGQTYFNPWKIVEWEELNESWKRFTPVVYRKSVVA
ncbi:hypothetical protein [Sporosarcina highlanderae]|uniref:NlpC/P60 family protein n=1 Tax=Sporosarcina highlanderae TaxID=3035916 RepID=A0ABT8JTN2_9BACL|nr:hypothetical protein [Sporosarcina highlanderae]MDN4608510.1 hypothetical protein [Sporosarcina highlanderae]